MILCQKKQDFANKSSCASDMEQLREANIELEKKLIEYEKEIDDKELELFAAIALAEDQHEKLQHFEKYAPEEVRQEVSNMVSFPLNFAQMQSYHGRFRKENMELNRALQFAENENTSLHKKLQSLKLENEILTKKEKDEEFKKALENSSAGYFPYEPRMIEFTSLGGKFDIKK